jgi:hypothetical protein
LLNLENLIKLNHRDVEDLTNSPKDGFILTKVTCPFVPPRLDLETKDNQKSEVNTWISSLSG